MPPLNMNPTNNKTTTTRARRRARNKRNGLKFPNSSSINMKATTIVSDLSQKQITTTKKKNKKNKRQKYRAFLWFFCFMTLPCLAIDLRTTRSKLWSLFYMWFGLSFFYLAWLYRDDLSSSTTTTTTTSFDPTIKSFDSKMIRGRSNQAGRSTGSTKKSSIQVKYEHHLRHGLLQAPADKQLTTKEMERAMKSRG